MKILAISDLHGFFPEVPACDILLLGGDYCPTRNLEHERRFMLGPFSEWLSSLNAKHIIGIAGNHDFILEQQPDINKQIPWIYVQDHLVEIEGIRIYGSPWTLPFYNWAFMRSESSLREIYSQIPEGLDILLTHGPAYRQLDKTEERTHTGSTSLLERIQDAKPKHHVFGHIHEARGCIRDYSTQFNNVSHVTRRYEPKHPVVEICI